MAWIRLDCNIYDHDKTLEALAEPAGLEAMAVYMFALAWIGGHHTDGFLPKTALKRIDGTLRHARVLVEVGYFEQVENGWKIVNWDSRQESAIAREMKRAAQRAAAKKTNCERYHKKDCGCWRQEGESDVA